MSAVAIAAQLAHGTSIIGSIAGGADAALPWVKLVGGFFPGMVPIITGLQIAAPIIQKVAAAAPIATRAIEAGEPLAAALDKAGPEMLVHLKELYAIFSNADPQRPQERMTASEVSDEEALRFAGPVLLGRNWTAEEESRWFDIAKGDVGGIGTGR